MTSLCGSLLRHVYGIIWDKREEPTYPELEVSKMARQEYSDFLVVLTLHWPFQGYSLSHNEAGDRQVGGDGVSVTCVAG